MVAPEEKLKDKHNEKESENHVCLYRISLQSNKRPTSFFAPVVSLALTINANMVIIT